MALHFLVYFNWTLTQGKLVQNGESLSRDWYGLGVDFSRKDGTWQNLGITRLLFSIWVAISMSYSVHCRCTFRQECFDCIGSTAKTGLFFSYLRCFRGKSWYCLKCILKYWHCLGLRNGRCYSESLLQESFSSWISLVKCADTAWRHDALALAERPNRAIITSQTRSIMVLGFALCGEANTL